jgi:hypothetical protein
MKRFFFFSLLGASSALSIAGCSVPDVPILPDGGVNDGGRHDGSAHDDGGKRPEDAEADRTSPHRDAGEDAKETDASKDDARATDGGGSITPEAGCSDPETTCGDSGTCVDEQTDPKNCGACGNDCTLAPHVDPQTTTCREGKCVYECVPGFSSDCGGDAGAGCPTSLSSPTNCGSCGHACAGATSLCTASTVDGGAASCASSCTGGTVLCNGSCVNDQTNPGACGSTCAVCPYVCTAGVCTGSCTPGTTGCSGSQPQICSSSGVWQDNGAACGECYACSAGACAPATGGACNDGNACTQTDTCVSGVCMGSNPVTCTASDNCHSPGTCSSATGTCSNPLASGANCQAGQSCIAWYPDCDQDTYGSNTTPVYSCSSPSGAPACPGGFSGVYVSNSQDCCDTDGNAHPNQAAYFTTPDACGSTTQAATPYDYNCDETDEQQSNGPTDCNTFTCTLNAAATGCVIGDLPADCNGGTTDYSLGACGATWNSSYEGCSYLGPPAGGCFRPSSGGPGGTQACH